MDSDLNMCSHTYILGWGKGGGASKHNFGPWGESGTVFTHRGECGEGGEEVTTIGRISSHTLRPAQGKLHFQATLQRGCGIFRRVKEGGGVMDRPTNEPREVRTISMSVPSPHIGQASYAIISTACSAKKKLLERVMMGAMAWPQHAVPPAAHGCMSECEKEG